MNPEPAQPANQVANQGRPAIPSYAPATTSEFANPQFAVWALSNEDTLAYIENTLRGRTPKIDGRTGEIVWGEPSVEPLLNDQGTFEVMRFLHGFTSKLTTLSKIPEEQMYRDLKDNAFTIITSLFYNYRRYGIKPSKFDLLCTELFNYIEFSLLKARGGATMEFLHPRHKAISYKINQPEKPEKKEGGSFLNLN